MLRSILGMDLVTVILVMFYPALVTPCDLVPLGLHSCLDLTSTAHISTQDTHFGRYIEGSSTNSKGEMFAVNYGNDFTLYTLGKFF